MEDLLGLHAEDLEWYQMGIRAVIVFTCALIFIRLAGMRFSGNMEPFDVVLNITMGAILARGIAGHYPFLTCLFTAGVLAACHRLTSFLVGRYHWFRKLAEGKPVKLFSEGEMFKDEIKKYFISDDDIQRALHDQSIEDLIDVKTIWYETDGKINVIKRKS